jgi:RNA polymerase sigma factor (sigma-70 family)
MPPERASENYNSTPPESGGVESLVEHFFRHQSGKLVSRLTRYFGVGRMEMAEDVVQETLLQALRNWSYHGVPDHPAAWLHRVAINRALDIVRREATLRAKTVDIAAEVYREAAFRPEITLLEAIEDDQLRMMFTCCHPAIPEHSQIALTLKTLCGFSVPEIARAFLSEETTVAQRLVRAKRLLRERNVAFDVPASGELKARLAPVLRVLYLLFNEGYSAREGEDLIRRDLCEEAVRLATLVAEHPEVRLPEARALLALLLLQSSRLDARLDEGGNLLLLAEQDRKVWDKALIQQGLAWLDRSAEGSEITTYHLEAEIAAHHALAESFNATDWQAVLTAYDELLKRTGSPVVAINRAVALGMVYGPQEAIASLEQLRKSKSLRTYHLLYSTLGYFYVELGNIGAAINCYSEAQSLTASMPEKRLLQRRIDTLQQELS